MAHVSLLEDLAAEAERDGVQQYVVGAFVQHEGKVLLLQRPQDDFMAGIFELPIVKVEAGEGLDMALVREVEEETGLDVTEILDYLDRFDYEADSVRNS